MNHERTYLWGVNHNHNKYRRAPRLERAWGLFSFHPFHRTKLLTNFNEIIPSIISSVGVMEMDVDKLHKYAIVLVWNKHFIYRWRAANRSKLSWRACCLISIFSACGLSMIIPLPNSLTKWRQWAAVSTLTKAVWRTRISLVMAWPLMSFGATKSVLSSMAFMRRCGNNIWQLA